MIVLRLFLIVAVLAGHTEDSSASAERTACRTVPTCLELFTNASMSPSDRYWAKIFLDDHPTEEVVAAIAPMLTSSRSKMREDGWWYVISNREAWRSQLPLLLDAVVLEPSNAFLVADIGKEDAWQPLEQLASTSSSAKEFAGALRRINTERAVESGLKVILGDFNGPDSDGFVDGVFEHFYVGALADAVRGRLEGIVRNPPSEEAHRLAVRAYSHTRPISTGVPEAIVETYRSASDSVRLEITARYGNRIATEEDVVMLVEVALDRGDMRELAKLGGIGQRGRRLSARIAEMMFVGPVSDQLLAAGALHEIDREAWRVLLPRLATHPDVLIALESTVLAMADSEESGAVAIGALSTHWFPGLVEAAQREFSARARAFDPIRREENEALQVISLSNDAVYAKAVSGLCLDVDQGAGGGRSIWTDPNVLELAAAEADVRGGVSAALRTDSGWIVGFDKGEFGGSISFAAEGAESKAVANFSAEPKLIFEWSGAIYALVGGDYFNSGAAMRLDRLDPSAGSYVDVPLLSLPAALSEVIIEGGRLLAHLVDNGWVDLSDPAKPHWIGCQL